MNTFNKCSEKGMVLMQEALKKYSQGDYEGGDKDRKSANKLLNEASAQINSEEGKITQLYGESRNFGIIFNVIEQNMDTLFESKQGKKFIKEMYGLIKNNAVLNEQFKTYDFFENSICNEDPKEFVNESLSVLGSFDKKQVKENNDKLIKLVRKYKLDEMVEIPEETENLYEAIEYILLNEKNLGNISKFMEATNVIVEHVANRKKNTTETKIDESKTFDDFKKKLVEEEKNVNESINEEERKLLDVFANPKTNKRSVFESYKQNTLDKLMQVINESDENERAEWNNIYENINKKTYSDKLSENIINCAEMLEICSTLND